MLGPGGGEKHFGAIKQLQDSCIAPTRVNIKLRLMRLPGRVIIAEVKNSYDSEQLVLVFPL